MINKYKDFLYLIRLGFGSAHNEIINNPINWKEVQVLAEQQGLLAVLVDGIEHLSESLRPPKEDLLQLIGSVLQGYEYRYDAYRRVIAEMAGFYNDHGLKMMVLKGYVCSLDWPKPEHRPCGDIDIWQFGKYKEADALLVKEKGIRVIKSHHHHTVFEWGGFTVENHYDFVNTYKSKSNRDIEKLFKELGNDDSCVISVLGRTVNIPTPTFNALFLLRHAASHFCSSELVMRNLLDWSFFVQAHTKEIDWRTVLDVLNEYQMTEFFDCINAICVEDLGFSSGIFPYVQFNPDAKARVLNAILATDSPTIFQKNIIVRTLTKYNQWKANEWKRKMCYNDTEHSSFAKRLWAHIVKPASI